MKQGIGTLLIIGLIMWWLWQRKPAQAAELLPGAIYPPEVSEYELLHRVVPITEYREEVVPVFVSIEEYREAQYG